MLNAVLKGKATRGRVGEEPVYWRELLRSSEDFVTASVFERLSYLSDETLWCVIRSAVEPPDVLAGFLAPGQLSAEFWPRWRLPDGREW